MTPAALTLSQAIFWRASICEALLYQRSCVFKPSDSRMMILVVVIPSFTMAGGLSGTPSVSDIQPQARPIAWLVLPLGLMASILLLSAVQSYVCGSIWVGQMFD